MWPCGRQNIVTSHYFEAQPAAAHRPGQVRVVLPDVYLELETDSGVFSPGRLDPGTRLLLEEAPPPPADGDLLDLGCGYGPGGLRAGEAVTRRARVGSRRERAGAAPDGRQRRPRGPGQRARLHPG